MPTSPGRSVVALPLAEETKQIVIYGFRECLPQNGAYRRRLSPVPMVILLRDSDSPDHGRSRSCAGDAANPNTLPCTSSILGGLGSLLTSVAHFRTASLGFCFLFESFI